ncbi:MAG: DUF6352 family protein [Hyphomicrobiales bacterium]|nr:DUF6352 family protein [Hyphomicrobiales bacterium]
MPDFWKAAGFHLVRVNAQGWLEVTPDYLRAYLTRPEVHPKEESCDNEHRLFDALMADPYRPVGDGEIAAIADADARDNYRLVLRFRDLLVGAGTVEGAYLGLIRSDRIELPPVFLDQMVHLMLRNVLGGCADPIRLRAAELFFRDQNVSVPDGRIMLADDEIVGMRAEAGGLGQLLALAGTAAKSVELDVLGEDNKEIYWQRSDRFDTVIDFRFTQPAPDAFARVIEAWVKHFLGVAVRVQPLQSITDRHWTWHVGLDSEATAILNALYEGREVSFDDMGRIVALFRMEFRDADVTVETMRRKPVYLGMAMTAGGKLRMKPQNILVNLPLKPDDRAVSRSRAS